MTEDVKPDVIKKTQDSLKRHIKKPPLTEKLLKKPPFRFLHDIVTNVIRETSFLTGLFTQEELNHENIKDRDGKIAFLDKLISAVKIITGIPLSVRATKVVAGHEPTKTNELLQAIGLALDKKLDSKDVAQQLRKKGSKADGKKSSSREVKQEKDDGSKSRGQEAAPNQTEERQEKKKSSTSKQAKDQAGQIEPVEKKKRSSSTSKNPKPKDSSKSSTSKPKKDAAQSDSKPGTLRETDLDVSVNPGQAEIPLPNELEPQILEPTNFDVDQKRPQSAVAQRRYSAVRQQVEDEPKVPQSSQHHQQLKSSKAERTSAESKSSLRDQEAVLSTTLPPLPAEPSFQVAAAESKSEVSSKAMPVGATSASVSGPPPTPSQPTAPAPVPLARPRTAARVGSARPGAPRIRNKGEAAVTEELVKPAPVNLIVEDDNAKTSHEDEDENLVVVETAPVEDISESHQPSAPPSSRPSSQQGHLVAQILETQKELEVATSGGDNGEILPHHTEIEWEAGKKRERETASKEVDRMRSLIQTLTRAAHPLGKLLDSLQEDVDNMQRELTQWQTMQISLEQQLQMEEALCSKASQPLKEQLKQLQQTISSQLEQISVAKANIINNDEKIHRLLTGGQS